MDAFMQRFKFVSEILTDNVSLNIGMHGVCRLFECVSVCQWLKNMRASV